MTRGVKTLKTYLGRVVRDVERAVAGANTAIQAQFSNLLSLRKKIINQTKKSKDKVYSLHEPDVYCVSKGKAGCPYEYGCKVQITLTHKQGLILSTGALHPNAYDGHTLQQSLLQFVNLRFIEMDTITFMKYCYLPLFSPQLIVSFLQF